METTITPQRPLLVDEPTSESRWSRRAFASFGAAARIGAALGAGRFAAAATTGFDTLGLLAVTCCFALVLAFALELVPAFAAVDVLVPPPLAVADLVGVRDDALD
jgi:hypothetical protein